MLKSDFFLLYHLVLQPQYEVNYKIAYIYVLFINVQAHFSVLLYIIPFNNHKILQMNHIPLLLLPFYRSVNTGLKNLSN